MSGPSPTAASARPRPAVSAASSASTSRARPSTPIRRRSWLTSSSTGSASVSAPGFGPGVPASSAGPSLGPGRRAVAVARPRDPRVALPREVLPNLFLGESVGHPDPEPHDRPLPVRLADQPVRDALRGVASHHLPAPAAVEPGEARVQQLQVVVDLRHGADRRARGPDLVGLVDRDGRRYAVDAVGAGPVHAVEELAGVGREGFDVAPLPLGVHRVEGERGLAGAADAGDDDELAQGKVDVEPFQVVLAGSADGDRALRRLAVAGGRGFHFPHYRALCGPGGKRGQGETRSE